MYICHCCSINHLLWNHLQIRGWTLIRACVRWHSWINGLISDFMFAEHSSCCLDKGQVQDEVWGDAHCQCSQSQNEISPPKLSVAEPLRFFGWKYAAPHRGVCWHFKLTKSCLCVKSSSISQSHSSAMPWLHTRSEICCTVSYFLHTCFW